MKRFFCVCGQALSFENVHCLACGRRLAFAPEILAMVALAPAASDCYTLVGDPMQAPRRLCENYAQAGICNWLAPPAAATPYCLSCALTRQIPDLSIDGNLARWARIEAAKRRLVYGLLALQLPFAGSATDDAGLRFSFLADMPDRQVVTGHENGLVTLSIAEADEATRAQTREVLGEPYRTLLGHLRHEAGHFFWPRLVGGKPAQRRFRALFGDETRDYAAALEHHYSAGPPADWPATFVSAYASAHPYEDWAETWAHYLHIRDTLDTARAYGLSIDNADLPPHAVDARWSFKDLVAAWLPVTFAVNELNRSMGQADMYPFVLPPAALEKLEFVHDLVIDAGASQGRVPPAGGTRTAPGPAAASAA
jgi:hypothetical protein